MRFARLRDLVLLVVAMLGIGLGVVLLIGHWKFYNLFISAQIEPLTWAAALGVPGVLAAVGYVLTPPPCQGHK